MSFLKSLFSSDQEPELQKFPWVNLNEISQIETVKQTSQNQTVLLFKHSTRCNISRMALKQFEQQFDKNFQVTPYFLDLLQHRDISNAISDEFNVTHQSPQLLVIKSGKAVFHASHEQINAEEIAPFVK